MARGRRNQDCGYGRMGGESFGVEKTTTEPEAGGNRLRVGNMSHTGAEAATIPLLPARRSFLMVDGDFVLPNSTHWPLVELLSIHPTNPALPSTYSNTIHLSVVRHNPSMLIFSTVFVGFCCCLWVPFFIAPVSYINTLRIHPFCINLLLPALLPPSSDFFSLTFRASHAGVVCFGLRVERIWMEIINCARWAQRCISILSTCMYVIRD